MLISHSPSYRCSLNPPHSYLRLTGDCQPICRSAKLSQRECHTKQPSDIRYGDLLNFYASLLADVGFRLTDVQLLGPMLMSLFYFALLPWANGQSTSASQNVTIPISSPTIALQTPGNLTSCQTTNIAWLASNFAGTRIPFTVSYTNQGAGEIVPSVISGVAVVVTDPSVQVAVWKVNITKSGRYILTGSAGGVNILSSDPFTVAVSNTSCFNSTTSTPTPTLAPSITTTSSISSSASTLLVASPTSLMGTDPSVVPVGGNSNGSKVASMVGAIFGSVIFVALLAALAFYRRHQSLKAQTHANSKPEKPKGHRKFGGLPSVDSTVVLDGIHTVRPNYANSRSESIKSVNNFDVTFEKGKPAVHEEERLADEVPTPFPRPRNQYSNGTLRGSLTQQDSGLAAFNNERARTASSDAASPATSLVEDPFLDNSPRVHGIRSQSFSVSSPVQGSPHSSNSPTQPSPLTQDGPGVPRTSENGGPESAMRRSKSATTRPTRKPVPRYDPPIEMTTTTPVYSHHSAKNSVTNVTSDSHTVLGSSVESTTPWLIDRAPSVNRNIGLAFQGDGPVHYLMPDMPPSSRN